MKGKRTILRPIMTFHTLSYSYHKQSENAKFCVKLPVLQKATPLVSTVDLGTEVHRQGQSAANFVTPATKSGKHILVFKIIKIHVFQLN